MLFINLIILPSLSIKLGNAIIVWVKFFLNVCISILALPLRKQGICNLVTILSLYCSLQCTHFVSRMLNYYVDLMAGYLLTEWIWLSHKETVVFCVLIHVLRSNNIQFEYEDIHSFKLYCMSSLNIDMEYIN